MMLGSLSSSQCQQLIALLSSQLQCSLPAIVESQQQGGPSISSRFNAKLILSFSYNSFHPRFVQKKFHVVTIALVF